MFSGLGMKKEELDPYKSYPDCLGVSNLYLGIDIHVGGIGVGC